MKVYAINGSPRKNKNTATILNHVLDGISSVVPNDDLTKEIIHLYDYNFTGCKSCFACKLIGGSSYGKCAIKDELQEILEKMADADIIVFGSPIYLGNISAQLKALLERYIFQYLVYDNNYSSIAPKKSICGMIYTMNVTQGAMRGLDYTKMLEMNESFIERIISKPEVLYVNDTYQFDDYSKYKVECFDEKKKSVVRQNQFPNDCKCAFELGKQLARTKLTK